MPKILLKFIFISISAVFLIGLAQLLNLRFQKGDIYPVYSSLRSDPLGTKVLFESLGNFKNISVKRNYQSLARVAGNTDSILLYLGARSEDFQLQQKDFYQSLDEYVVGGGRLVISFLPTSRKGEKNSELLSNKNPKGANDKVKKEDMPEDEKVKNLVSMEKHWGIAFDYDAAVSKKEGGLMANKISQDLNPSHISQKDLPQSLNWHSTLSFHCLNDSWHTLYAVNKKPVMVEKLLGRGSIILMADSFLFSNEALLRDRQLNLLSTFFQGRQEIVFDEYHLGVINQYGIIDLMVKYRLHFLLLSLFFIFMLVIWKNSSLSLSNLQNIETEQLIESRKDYFEGLVSLLRKNIPTKDILKVCIEEWGTKKDQEIKRGVDGVLVSDKNQKSDPVEGYQLIYRKLTEGRNRHKLIKE